jgi:hypothetical protein
MKFAPPPPLPLEIHLTLVEHFIIETSGVDVQNFKKDSNSSGSDLHFEITKKTFSQHRCTARI